MSFPHIPLATGPMPPCGCAPTVPLEVRLFCISSHDHQLESETLAVRIKQRLLAATHKDVVLSLRVAGLACPRAFVYGSEFSKLSYTVFLKGRKGCVKERVRSMEDRELVRRILTRMMVHGETGREAGSAVGEMWEVMEDVREERRRRVRRCDRGMS